MANLAQSILPVNEKSFHALNHRPEDYVSAWRYTGSRDSNTENLQICVESRDILEQAHIMIYLDRKNATELAQHILALIAEYDAAGVE